MEDVGDWASGESGSGVEVVVAKAVVSQWVTIVLVVVALFPILSWTRRRCFVSLVIALLAFASTGNHMAGDGLFLGMDGTYWVRIDQGASVLLLALGFFYVCSIRHPGIYLLTLIAVCLFAANAYWPGYDALHLAWHAWAFILLGLIPGQLPMSVDDPDYYYAQRRQRRSHVLLPREDPWDDVDRGGVYPGLFIPPGGGNYFQ